MLDLLAILPVQHVGSVAWMGLCVGMGVRVQRRAGAIGQSWAASWRLALLYLAVIAGAELAVYEVFGSVPGIADTPFPSMPPLATPASIGSLGWAMIGLGLVLLSIFVAVVSLGTWLLALVGYGMARLLAGPPLPALRTRCAATGGSPSQTRSA